MMFYSVLIYVFILFFLLRHVLPLFTSLLNVVCAYDPVGYGLPYNYLLFADSREPLVQSALQVLVACLDNDNSDSGRSAEAEVVIFCYFSWANFCKSLKFCRPGITIIFSLIIYREFTAKRFFICFFVFLFVLLHSTDVCRILNLSWKDLPDC